MVGLLMIPVEIWKGDRNLCVGLSVMAQGSAEAAIGNVWQQVPRRGRITAAIDIQAPDEMLNVNRPAVR